MIRLLWRYLVKGKEQVVDDAHLAGWAEGFTAGWRCAQYVQKQEKKRERERAS